ncbi:MAG TPA: glycosyltransferase family 39 protein, partial [Beijerinckiaceae bacterium]|nr:glycosyltransferase family 39 protein [Beijerinckiaceae bacterium]
GVVYLDKTPLNMWLMAASYCVFGVHDWAARIPFALAAILLAWIVYRFGAWAFTPRAGFYSAAGIATCLGMYLFTRTVIPDVMLAVAVAALFWSFSRALDPVSPPSLRWPLLAGAALGAGLLLKGLIAAVLPCGIAALYLAVTRSLRHRDTWTRLRPFTIAAVALMIAAPWFILATLRNPPYFDFTLSSGPGLWRGFFWRYFINEHVLRFLNLRYPRDYNTVPAVWYWLMHLVWLFPWSAYLAAVATRWHGRALFSAETRSGRVRLLALLWVGVVTIFFALSTSQEYYTMPAYPALFLLIGSAIDSGGRWVAWGSRVAGGIAALCFAATTSVLVSVAGKPTPFDISAALTQNPEVYSLSMGHFLDLTLGAFAYLRLPLAIAAAAFAAGAFALIYSRNIERAVLSLACMMVLFNVAAQRARAVFEPYLSSRPIADAINARRPDWIVFADEYDALSSVAFYTNRRPLIWEGRFNNLEYGSNAPGAPDIFLDDARLRGLWSGDRPVAIVTRDAKLPRLETVLGSLSSAIVMRSGGKLLLLNRPA